MTNRWGNSGNSEILYFGGLQPLQMVIAVMKLKDSPQKESHDQPRQHIKKQKHYIKKQRHYFTNKGPSSQNFVFSSSHVLM